jgi:ribonuclease BN (tRNA processing enzyme)
MRRQSIHLCLRGLVVFAALLVSGVALADSDPSPAAEIVSGTKIVLLGTGTPNADPDRFGPATAIVVNGTPYLIDCGPGVVRRATAAGIAAKDLKHLFVTHLHSDHTTGFSDLIFTPWVLERETPLEVYGPDGIAEMAEHIIAAYEHDIRMRLDGLEPANDSGYLVNTHNITAGVIYRDSNVTVESIAVTHGSWKESYGFVFTTADRKIVISGDCAPSDAVVAACDGCDVLIHEVYSAVKFQDRSPIWQKYHSSFHTSTVELAEIAKRAKPKMLILYHQLFWGATEEELLAEITELYDGVVVSGDDLDVF